MCAMLHINNRSFSLSLVFTTFTNYSYQNRCCAIFYQQIYLFYLLHFILAFILSTTTTTTKINFMTTTIHMPLDGQSNLLSIYIFKKKCESHRLRWNRCCLGEMKKKGSCIYTDIAFGLWWRNKRWLKQQYGGEKDIDYYYDDQHRQNVNIER